jgi:hypothetical protein
MPVRIKGIRGRRALQSEGMARKIKRAATNIHTLIIIIMTLRAYLSTMSPKIGVIKEALI